MQGHGLMYCFLKDEKCLEMIVFMRKFCYYKYEKLKLFLLSVYFFNFFTLSIMTITWYGQSCFKIQTKTQEGEMIVLTDPFSYEVVGLHPPRGKADIVLVSHQHKDHNNSAPYEGAFMVVGAGEYDVRGISIKGIQGWHEKKKVTPITMYCIESEDLKVCHASDIGQDELTDEQVENIGEIDVLFIPVGGTYTVDAQGAQKIINQLEPKIVIPMHYKVQGSKIDLDGVEKFLKVMGENGVEPQEKLILKKKDLTHEGTKVFVLKAGKE